MRQHTSYPELDHLSASGSWYDIGLAEGQSQRPMVRYTVYRYATYHEGMREHRAIPEFADKSMGFLEECFPREAAELRGIADGAEVDLGLLVACNFPVGLKAFAGTGDDLAPERNEQCSNIMFPASELGPLIGGTLDDDPIRYVLTAHPDDGIPFCAIMWPGWIACSWGGMNEKGLAICGASAGAMRTENQWHGERTHGIDALWPQRVLLHSCATVGEALERLSEADLDMPGNLSLMDATGRGVQVQGYQPDGRTLRIQELPQDEGLCCGNFFTWELTAEDFAQFPDMQPVFSRYGGLKRAVDDHKGRYTVEAMKAALAGHEGDPRKLESVCNNNTIVAMVAAPTQHKLLLASRPPCVQGFKDYSLR